MQAHYDFNVHDSALDGDHSSENENKKSSEKESTLEDNLEDNTDVSEKSSHPSWIKKIYRKI